MLIVTPNPKISQIACKAGGQIKLHYVVNGWAWYIFVHDGMIFLPVITRVATCMVHASMFLLCLLQWFQAQATIHVWLRH